MQDQQETCTQPEPACGGIFQSRLPTPLEKHVRSIWCKKQKQSSGTFICLQPCMLQKTIVNGFITSKPLQRASIPFAWGASKYPAHQAALCCACASALADSSDLLKTMSLWRDVSCPAIPVSLSMDLHLADLGVCRQAQEFGMPSTSV